MKYKCEGHILSEDIYYGGTLLFKKGTVVTHSISRLLNKLQLSDKIKTMYDEREFLLCNGHSSQLLFDVLKGKTLGKRYLILRDRLSFLTNQMPLELIQLVEDAGVLNHSISVALYSASMAIQDDLGLDAVDTCLIGGFLHDIGKSKIPSEVLDKDTYLTPEEFHKISEHTKLGAEILLEYKFPMKIVMCALNHHERSDGKGYPNGIALNTLPAEVAYLHITDIYDAISSERVYKPSLSRASAQRYIKKDKQYSKELLATFLKAVPILLPGECTYVNSTQLVLEDVTYDKYTLQSNGKRICLPSEEIESKIIKDRIWR